MFVEPVADGAGQGMLQEDVWMESETETTPPVTSIGLAQTPLALQYSSFCATASLLLDFKWWHRRA